MISRLPLLRPFLRPLLCAFSGGALLGAVPAVADDRAQEPASTLSSEAKGPALWKVSDEDTTIYLFGTFHFLPEGSDWYTTEVATALESSDVIVGELGPASETAEAYQSAIVKHGVLPPEQSLGAMLTQDQRNALSARLAELEPQLAAQGLDPQVIDRLRPWYVFLGLSIAKFVEIGFNPQTGAEAILFEKASGKERLGLETIDFQFGIFASLSEEEQVALLMETIDGLDDIESLLPTMAVAWVNGRADKIAELLNDDFNNSGLTEAILFERNANWAEWIDARLESTPGTVFMAVGAGHLAGEKSVQDYLATRDIETVRVQ